MPQMQLEPWIGKDFLRCLKVSHFRRPECVWHRSHSSSKGSYPGNPEVPASKRASPSVPSAFRDLHVWGRTPGRPLHMPTSRMARHSEAEPFSRAPELSALRGLWAARSSNGVSTSLRSPIGVEGRRFKTEGRTPRSPARTPSSPCAWTLAPHRELQGTEADPHRTAPASFHLPGLCVCRVKP